VSTTTCSSTPRRASCAPHAAIVLHNDAPAGLPGEDYFPELPEGADKIYLSVYTPWAAASSTLDGASMAFTDERELGRRVYSGGIVVPAGGSTTIELSFSGRLPRDGRYHLDLHRQPTAAPDHVGLTVQLTAGWRVEDGRSTWSERFERDADRSVTPGHGRRLP
jgi:hypothetical protein